MPTAICNDEMRGLLDEGLTCHTAEYNCGGVGLYARKNLPIE